MPSTYFEPHHQDPESPVSSGTPQALIYFIPGNPGLIDFYQDFLGILAHHIRASPIKRAYDVYGRDLCGFNDDSHPPFSATQPPWDLEGQVKDIYEDVLRKAKEGDGYEFVVLMGHSVGAYIATEIIHRHMQKTKEGTKVGGGKGRAVDLRHGALLFPTLTHIAQSPSGVRATYLQRVPFVDANFHRLAGALLWCFSEATIRWVVETIMGFSPQAATVVARWLKSRDGVWQAVHLGQSELATIREDVWEKELWDVVERDDEQAPPPRFFLFYAKQDHWVADRLRDEFIESRKGASVRVLIDEGGIPHAFCTREKTSWDVAVAVSKWVEEIEGVPRPQVLN